MHRYRKRNQGRRMLLLLFLAIAGISIAAASRQMHRVFMEYAANVCEDSAIQEINNLMQDEVFSDPDAALD